MGADAFSLNRLAHSDRKFYLFIPGMYFSKIISRYFLLFFLVVFAFVLSYFSAIFLPVYFIVFYKFYLFTIVARQFNISSVKLWLATGLWSLILCLPLSILLKRIIII